MVATSWGVRGVRGRGDHGPGDFDFSFSATLAPLVAVHSSQRRLGMVALHRPKCALLISQDVIFTRFFVSPDLQGRQTQGGWTILPGDCSSLIRPGGFLSCHVCGSAPIDHRLDWLRRSCQNIVSGDVSQAFDLLLASRRRDAAKCYECTVRVMRKRYLWCHCYIFWSAGFLVERL